MPDRQLGQRGRPRDYCNRFCYSLANGYLKSPSKPEFCLWCGIALNQENRPGTPKKFCSLKHNAKYRQANQPKVPKISKTCDWCKDSFITNRKGARFCKQNCRENFYRHEKLEATKARRLANPRQWDFHCDRCKKLVVTDVMVTRGKYGRYCRNCALLKQRENYRVKTAKRQKVTQPIRISADVLIERDGNLCRLCDTEIDLSLARNSRWGATIDHIIPLSKGGADELDNLQLAHWICNIKKGNRVDA